MERGMRRKMVPSFSRIRRVSQGFVLKTKARKTSEGSEKSIKCTEILRVSWVSSCFMPCVTWRHSCNTACVSTISDQEVQAHFGSQWQLPWNTSDTFSCYHCIVESCSKAQSTSCFSKCSEHVTKPCRHSYQFPDEVWGCLDLNHFGDWFWPSCACHNTLVSVEIISWVEYTKAGSSENKLFERNWEQPQTAASEQNTNQPQPGLPVSHKHKEGILSNWGESLCHWVHQCSSTWSITGAEQSLKWILIANIYPSAIPSTLLQGQLIRWCWSNQHCCSPALLFPQSWDRADRAAAIAPQIQSQSVVALNSLHPMYRMNALLSSCNNHARFKWRCAPHLKTVTERNAWII